MARPKQSSGPFDDVRSAFDGLDTSEKAAFVLEATFNTLGQALNETGRRVAKTIDDMNIDDWFRPMAADPKADPASPGFAAPPPPPPVPPPPAGKPSGPPPSEPLV